MGWNNTIFPLIVVTSGSGFTGLFEYSPGPGTGNLVSSDAAAGGTDPYGNVYLPGFVSYNPGPSSSSAIQHNSNSISFYTGPAHGAGPWILAFSQFYTVTGAVQFTGTSAGLQNFLLANTGGSIQYVFPSGDLTGVTDATNISGALSGNRGVVFLSGAFVINSTISVPSNTSLTGPLSAINTTPGASDVMPAIIKLASGSNVNMLSVTGNNSYVGNLELDGNIAGQTTAGHGINYSGGFFATFENLFIHSCFSQGINCANGSAAQIRGCSITSNGGNGVLGDTSSNDLHIRDNQIGRNLAAGLALAGFVTHITDNDIFNNGGNGVLLTAGRGHQIVGNGIDHNGQHGISLAPAAATAMGSVSIVGNTFHSNSQNLNAGFNNINVNNPGGGATTDGVTVAANNFWLDGGIVNLPNWHINYAGGVVTKTHGNQFQAASSVAGTISAASQVKDANETA